MKDSSQFSNSNLPVQCNNSTKRWSYIWFQHVRKSGGSSLCNLLWSNLNEKKTHCFIYNLTASLAHEDWRDFKKKADRKNTSIIAFEWESFRVDYVLNHLDL